MVVVNMFYDTGLSLESDQVDVEKYKKEICHLAFVGLRRDSCVKFFTQNWCPWFKTPEEHLPIWATNIICETKTLNTPGFDVSPFCYDGMEGYIGNSYGGWSSPYFLEISCETTSLWWNGLCEGRINRLAKRVLDNIH